MPVLAEDDMIVHRDSERRGDVDNGFRHLHIRLRRRRIISQTLPTTSTGSAKALKEFRQPNT
jgi:glyceraldehyde-3-phosphate dehydrogenase/erythrose-4-phosphate dehydrogenase